MRVIRSEGGTAGVLDITAGHIVYLVSELSPLVSCRESRAVCSGTDLVQGCTRLILKSSYRYAFQVVPSGDLCGGCGRHKVRGSTFSKSGRKFHA